tara:strand:- start:332 stop:814 length:483 start_codon:yes stop_codon:yes gene_type:complete
MRYTLPLFLLLVSCQSWGWDDTADVLIPDEFTWGVGSSTVDTAGGYNGHSDIWEYLGDGESSYAALTWHLPSMKSDNGMSRETQRNLALLVNHMTEEEGLNVIEGDAEESNSVATAGPLKLNLRPGVSLPPKEVLFGVLGALLLVFLLIRYKAATAQRRW